MGNKKYSEGQKQKAIEFIDRLQELYPAAFPKKPLEKVPLAIGITEQLISIKTELGVSKNIIQLAMYLWCSGGRYKEARKFGSPRYNLDGSQAGVVINQEGLLMVLAKLKSKQTHHKNGTVTLLIEKSDLDLIESLTLDIGSQ